MFGSSAVYLNDQQLSIVNSNIDENQKILACAGSGKTTTIICRIKFLVEKGVDPSKIWMTAFNIDAARQIKEKLSLVMGKELSEKVKVNNIDKISKGLLCKFDTNFQKKISLQSKEMEKMKEKFDEEGLTESEFNRKGYYKIKDFTPMLLKYFQQNQQVVPQMFDYFFFDEFQDVNPDEYEFLKYLAHQGVKVSVIGDDAQNIYSFRDSVVDIIQSQINKDIPNIKSYYLTTNYRSSPEIVHFANEVVKASDVLIKKQMLADKFSCEQKPLLKKMNSVEEQNQYVIEYIQQQIYQKQKNPEQIAVLCRNNRPLQIFEDQLLNYNKKQEFKDKQINISPKPINYVANFTSENLNQNKESDENNNQESENNKKNVKGRKNLKNEGKKTQRSLLNFMGSNQNPHFQKPITLSTIHKAKGLEWDVVIIIHCNDEFFPGSSQVEEERRVFYVAVTRAKIQLLITYINNEQVFKLSRFVNQINAKYFEGDFQSQQEIYIENQLRMLKEKNENQQEIKMFEQQQKDEEDFITKDQIQSAKKLFNLEEILNYLDIQGQIKQKYYNKLNLLLEKELNLEFLENVNNFYKKQGGLKIESCNLPGNLGNWIVANNMHNVYYNFLRHFLIRAIIFQVYVNKNDDYELIKKLKLMLINQEAETVLYNGEKEKNFTYIKDQKKYQQFSKSYEIFQCIDKEPLDIIEDIYRVSVMKYILQDKQMFIQREDILKNFMVQSNLLKNCYKKFVCKYIIENSLSSENNLQEFKFGEQLEFQIDENMENYKNVYANLNKEKLQKFKNENNFLKLHTSMDLIIGNTLVIFQFINYQGLQFNDIVRLYFQIAILKIKNINKIQFVKIYNPLKGNVFTINVLKFYDNHMEQFLNLIFEVQTTLIGQIIPQILSKQAQQQIKSKKNITNNPINVRFEGIHDFEDSQSDNYQNENNDIQFKQNEINNKIEQNQNLQRNLNKTVFQGFQSATQILQSQNQEKQQKLEEKNCQFKQTKNNKQGFIQNKINTNNIFNFGFQNAKTYQEQQLKSQDQKFQADNKNNSLKIKVKMIVENETKICQQNKQFQVQKLQQKLNFIQKK
ncbi:P-loop containing nucleoside triphosphate hydrolase [Pseudocohnilembus persalinus]|uniref:DNA 3'-5' helicase n=1 Tax=Pseudocohnilembus persalinus TaxID=266149 RepID=A0A0V0R7G9_PSEPJ|nr:P-loop containing nucleoside triphosphate hydrolase [Pseudocohnilembus persalinus]|eukprot:KRX10425.1 P-loop containing nucleoside triphosphate hydrolase [Pseudocohnilembus persalinus]